MTQIQTTPGNFQNPDLIGILQQAQQLNAELDAVFLDFSREGALRSHQERLSALIAPVRGRMAEIVPVDDDSQAITAYHLSNDLFTWGHEVPQGGGLFLNQHPKRAVGRIRTIDISAPDNEVLVTPRWFSPYRRGQGYFSIRMLCEAGKPLVKVKFL